MKIKLIIILTLATAYSKAQVPGDNIKFNVNLNSASIDVKEIGVYVVPKDTVKKFIWKSNPIEGRVFIPSIFSDDEKYFFVFQYHKMYFSGPMVKMLSNVTSLDIDIYTNIRNVPTDQRFAVNPKAKMVVFLNCERVTSEKSDGTIFDPVIDCISILKPKQNSRELKKLVDG